MSDLPKAVRAAGLCAVLLACGDGTMTGNAPGQTPVVPSPGEPAPAISMRLVALTPTMISDVVGGEVTPVPAVRIIDQRDTPLAGVQVQFELILGDGRLVGASAISDVDGVVRPATWTLGTRLGTNILRATLAANNGTIIEFTANAHAGTPATILLTSGEGQRAETGETLPESLLVKVVDVFGNAVAGTDVGFSVTAGGGTVRGTARTNDDGVASAGRWTLGPIPGDQRVLASSEAARAEFRAVGREPCTTRCDTGRSVAFVREGDIYLANADGTGLIRLTHDGISGDPAWSPDGRRIAFTRWNTFFGDIYLIDTDGGNDRLFARDASSPSWSPDGRQLAYSAWRGESKILVASARNDGKAPVDVGNSRGVNEHPAWSPDGKTIAFVNDWNAFDFAMEVYVVNPDGSGLRQVTNGFFGRSSSWPTYTTYRQPAWSPDGRRLAVVACEEWQYYSCKESSVAVIAVDGTGFRTLSATTGYARPMWLSNESLGFSRTCHMDAACSPRVVVLPLNGGPERVLIANAESAAWRP